MSTSPLSEHRLPIKRSVRFARAALLYLLPALALLLWLATSRSSEEPAPPAASINDNTAAPATAAPPSLPAAHASPAESPHDAGAKIPPVSKVVSLPPAGTNARRKEWLRAKFGKAHNELGYYQITRGGESRTPQSFTPTPDGKLLVLDSEKNRLVWYSADGQLERTRALPELVQPADVTMADDGTVVVMDRRGTETKGTLILNPDGTPRAMLPQIVEPTVGIDVIGDSIYAELAMTSIKVGDLDGTPTHETPGLYDQNGDVPGVVGADERTVINVTIRREMRDRFLVSVLRDEPPHHMYTRQFRSPRGAELIGIPYVQTDHGGTLYISLVDKQYREVLVCFDLDTGEPRGAVEIPRGSDPGYTFRRRHVDRHRGSVVYQRFTSDTGVIYETFDCR